MRTASDRTKYPRRDAVVMMQADFTDQPEHLPELVKRFEGGADVVAVERVMARPRRSPSASWRGGAVAPASASHPVVRHGARE